MHVVNSNWWEFIQAPWIAANDKSLRVQFLSVKLREVLNRPYQFLIHSNPHLLILHFYKPCTNNRGKY